jgi:WD40 repeat protein
MKKIFSLLLLPLLLFLSCGTKNDVRQILKIRGDVQVNGATAILGQRIGNGDRISTGDRSSCDLLIGTKDIVRIIPNSDLLFDSQRFSFTLQKGGILSVVQKLAKSKGYQIRTPTAVVGVRGTTFFVSTKDGKEIYTCCCNGTIRLFDNKAEKLLKEVTATHHKGTMIRDSSHGPELTDAGMFDHTDADIGELAGQINEQFDWLVP